MNLTYKTAVFFFLMVSMNSCKQNSEKKNIETKTIEQTNPIEVSSDEPSHFSLTLKALIEKDDLFQLYYIQENTESYTADQVLTQEVIGKNQFQDVTFNLPPQYYPFNFRLDFGTNPVQSSIKIEECTLRYGSSKFVIKGSKLDDYFIFNGGVEILPDSTTFRLKTFKEGNKDKYDPFLMGNFKLNDVLLKKL